VIHVLPQPQAGENSISAADYAVAVAALRWPIIFGQCQKSIGSGGRGLRCEVAEQFCPIIN
jgi:hypothetical protein